LASAQRRLDLQVLAAIADQRLVVVRSYLVTVSASFAVGFGFHFNSPRELLLGLFTGAQRRLHLQTLAAIAEQRFAVVGGYFGTVRGRCPFAIRNCTAHLAIGFGFHDLDS